MHLIPPGGIGLDDIHAAIDDHSGAFVLKVNGLEIFRAQPCREQGRDARRTLLFLVSDAVDLYTQGALDVDGYADGANDWRISVTTALANVWDTH